MDLQMPQERPPFGQWLLDQAGRSDWVGTLAHQAKADPRFPKQGDPEAVRTRMREVQADGDTWAALEDAELDWVAY